MKMSRSDFRTGARLANSLIQAPHVSSSISSLKFFPQIFVHSAWLALHPAAVPSVRLSYSYTKLLSYSPTVEASHTAIGDEPAGPSSGHDQPVDTAHLGN